MIGANMPLHGLLGRVSRRKLGVRLHHLLDSFDNDNGIVDDDADRQNHRQQRHRIGRISNGIEDDEGADQD
jgi:hypothetical protein